MEELKQNKLIFYRHYFIKEEGVKFVSSTFEGYAERTIKYEEIDFDEQIYNERAPQVRIFLACSLMLNILFIIATISSGGVKNAFESLFLVVVVCLTAGAIVYFIKKEKNKYLVGTKNIPFWYESIYKLKVDNFIEELKVAKKQYMRKKYMKMSDWEDEFTIKGKLNWLHEQNYINELEMKDGLKELEQRKIIRG
jgi:hypothetical protein